MIWCCLGGGISNLLPDLVWFVFVALCFGCLIGLRVC